MIFDKINIGEDIVETPNYVLKTDEAVLMPKDEKIERSTLNKVVWRYCDRTYFMFSCLGFAFI